MSSECNDSGLEVIIQAEAARRSGGNLEYNFKMTKYIKNYNETAVLTWDPNKTLNTASANTNMYVVILQIFHI